MYIYFIYESIRTRKMERNYRLYHIGNGVIPRMLVNVPTIASTIIVIILIWNWSKTYDFQLAAELYRLNERAVAFFCIFITFVAWNCIIKEEKNTQLNSFCIFSSPFKLGSSSLVEHKWTISLHSTFYAVESMCAAPRMHGTWMV